MRRYPGKGAERHENQPSRRQPVAITTGMAMRQLLGLIRNPTEMQIPETRAQLVFSLLLSAATTAAVAQAVAGTSLRAWSEVKR
jgi:hypothetical protein